MSAIAGVSTALDSAPPTSPSTNPAGGTTITANDFLTLLVAQMKNQDPTSPTDPSQYMQQLVEVNSLQQLIGINQKLPAATSSTSTTGTQQS